MSASAIPLPETDSEYMTLHQATRVFGVSRSTLWRWTQERGLPRATLGRKTFFRRLDLRNLIESGFAK